MVDKKPGLAILIGHALAKKGKSKFDPAPDMEKENPSEDVGESDIEVHLKEIADDFLKAIEEKDADAIKDLLREAFEALEAEPHEEGTHIS